MTKGRTVLEYNPNEKVWTFAYLHYFVLLLLPIILFYWGKKKGESLKVPSFTLEPNSEVGA